MTNIASVCNLLCLLLRNYKSVRRSAAIGAFALLILVAHRAGSQSGPGNRVRELAPGVFFWQGDLPTRTQTNVGWVVFQDYVFVIDANFPWGARDILPAIRKTTGKPIRFVFDTHYHADHAYGNGVFAEAGAAVVSSEECAEESRRKGPRDVANQAKGRTPEALVHPTVVFEKRMAFDDGQRRVELTRLGPAHTRGDAVAYLPKEKILFVGDLAVNWIFGNNLSDPDADHANWVRALDQLSQWNAAVVVPSHGELGTIETLKGQRGYLGEMLDRVQAGIRDGKTADDLAQGIDLSRRRPFGSDPARTASQVRSMYRALTTRAH